MNDNNFNKNASAEFPLRGDKMLIVVGGGAAGFFCAINAARMNPSLKVTIVEKNNKGLSKVKVSGGGRCNVTHACFEINELIKKYPRGQNFLKKSFHWFNTKDTVDWFEERNIKLKTESDGRMFPETNSSQTIIDCLLKEATKYGVEIILNCEVKEIKKENNYFKLTAHDSRFSIHDSRFLTSNFLCIACGGYPKSSQTEWLQNIGHSFEMPVPSLFTFNIPNNKITELMGVSIENATVKIVGTKLQEQAPLLITHWGMSGPAVLKLSAWGARILAEKNYRFEISVNWLGNRNENELRNEWIFFRDQFASQKIGNRNPFNLPNRLWLHLLRESFIDEGLRWAELTSKQQNKLIQTLTAQAFEVKGKTTFKEEFVTCGGIKLNEVDANTMQSKIVPHLFFAGEIMDVDGITGGFNFQNAWTGGWIAAKTIAEI
ncbi:MAG TPA: NAD(P)/FAD-dependent oxidoreductase [Chitinophagaceae bacterium]|nr:NAD(P)/FAD-dependent oxidoreductase [Chitinophagaceae bacterium]